MATTRAYDEIIDFIARGSSPQEVVDYRPSDASRRRVLELLDHQRAGELTAAEASELEHYSQLEHIMRLAKARARERLSEL